MKNNRIQSIMSGVKVLLLTVIILLAGCTDKFLDIRSTSADTLEDYYRTEEQIFKTLVGAYDPLQWTDYYGGYNQFQFLGDLRGDDIYVGGDKGSDNFFHQMQRYQMQPVDAPQSLWECLYTGVERCNTVLEYLPKIEDIDDAKREGYAAEACFLRAWYYHLLWKFWGNVPYYNQVLKEPYAAPQISADSLYTQIMKDLDYAIGNVTETQIPRLPYTIMSGPTLGRATGSAAIMLKARCVLYQNDSKRFDEVIREMRGITMSGFVLTPLYDSIWTNNHEFITVPGERSSTESIWEINHREEGGSWSWPQGAEGTIYPKFIGVNGLDGDPEFQDGWAFGPIREEIYRLFEEGDQRRDASIININERAKLLKDSLGITISWAQRANHTGYYNKKYTARKGYNNCPYDPELNFNNNIRVFRYSEALLNLAELCVRTNRASMGQPYLDQVRMRAFQLTAQEYTASNPHYRPISMEAIMMERRLEFVGEGLRFWDLVRWSHAEDVDCDINTILSGTDAVGNYTRQWNDNWKWLPIPSLEIDRTEGLVKLNQNPGY
ncbi:MAG: RagB/SusD family nutrient uptake outer membrane protein [Paludibacteraceae bacterium]|nr:RagB/SusD family nutrient uptake outer membrane protein [Paludibacteraceae bacterium]